MKQYKSTTFKTAVTEFAQKLHKHLGLHRTLRITWTGDITTAGINKGGHMYLADIDDHKIVSHATLIKYCGFIVHELCHAKWTNFSVTFNNKYPDSLLNAVEDAWIEHNAIRTVLTGNVESLLTELVETMVKDGLNAVKDWSDPRQYPFVLAVYLRNHARTKVPLAQGLEPIFAEAKARLVNSNSTADNALIAKWVYEQLQNLPKDSEQKPTQKPSESSQGDDQGEGEGEGTPDGQTPSNGDGGTARQPSQGDIENPAPVEPTLTPDSSTGGNYSEDATLESADEVLSSDVLRSINSMSSGRLRHEVRQLFENSGIESWQRNRKSGAVNVHALPLAGHTDRVFKRRQEVEGIDSAVVIVLDVSGSMKGNRLDTAVDACAALIDTLGRAQVSVCVIAFHSYASVLLPFGTNYRKATAILSRLKTGGNTNDYFGVRHAHKLLSERDEQRKVCFVLSDGDGHIYRTRQQVEVGKRMGITTIGIGIKHDVSNVYDQSIKVDELKDLGVATFKQIKLAV